MREMTTKPRWRWRVGLLVVVATVVLIGFLALVAMSPIPMRGAAMFGRIANKIKGNPGATAYWALGAGAAMWLTVGGLVALQEWRGRNRGAA
jgi:hypothetical protein